MTEPHPEPLEGAGPAEPPTDPAPVLLSARGLHKRFDQLEVLKGIDLDVPSGSVAVVISPAAWATSINRPASGSVTCSSAAVAFRSRTVTPRGRT